MELEFMDELPEGHNQSAVYERKRQDEQQFEAFIKRILNDKQQRWARVGYRPSQFCGYAKRQYKDALEFKTVETFNSGLLTRDTYIRKAQSGTHS